jgi:UDPglucose--hexose-1-phosphate uridylyltransferase
MEKAAVDQVFTHSDYGNVKAAIVKWPMSVVRLSSHNKLALLKLADKLLVDWKAYSDRDADILAFTEKDGKLVPHNTITPIARNNAKGEYELDLVLRNNRTSEEHPDGIFHPHKELHHIKKENIGLIEVMGLAVLPGRLQAELVEIAKLLTGEVSYQAGALREDETHLLHKHSEWIDHLLAKYGTGNSLEQATAALQAEVGEKFLGVLLDAGVYKRTAEGQGAFARFLNSAGFEQG